MRSSFRSVSSSSLYREVRPDSSMGAVRVWISAFTPLNRPFPGAKLDVPRLAAPRGPARGRARANRPGLSYRMFESHSGAPCLARARFAQFAEARARPVSRHPSVARRRRIGTLALANESDARAATSWSPTYDQVLRPIELLGGARPVAPISRCACADSAPECARCATAGWRRRARGCR